MASKEDPAHLATDFDAINVDIEDFDIETNTNLYDVPNFVAGSALDLPFEDSTFKHVVLGEFLEHCTEEAARKALTEAMRVLVDGGVITLTLPHDTRPPLMQRRAKEIREYCEGVTSWHQTAWHDDDLRSLFRSLNLDILIFRGLRYAVCDSPNNECFGFGILVQKRNGVPDEFVLDSDIYR